MLKPSKVQEIWSFDAYFVFVDGTIVNDVPDYRQAPVKTALSEKLAKDLKRWVLSSPDQSQFYPTYKQQAWSIMRMIRMENGD